MSDKRTVADVLAAQDRATVGCCDDFADYRSCDCLARARLREELGRFVLAKSEQAAEADTPDGRAAG